MSRSENQNSPSQQPLETQPEATQNPHKLKRTLASASLVLSGMVIGSVVDENINTDHQVEAVTNVELSGVASDIARAVKVDTCDTKVSATDVMSIYKRLYSETKPIYEFAMLEKATESAVDKIQAKLKKVPLASLTAEEQSFSNTERANGLNGDYEDYHSALQNYLDQFDIELIDTWKPNDAIGKRMDEAGITDSTKALSKSELSNNKSAKAQILNVLNGLSRIPKKVITESGVKTIFLGDSLEDSYDGIAYSGSKSIGFDVHEGKTNDANEALGLHMSNVVPHEFAHAIDYQLCNNFTAGYVGDPGFESLNRAFRYGEEQKKILESNQTIPGRYTMLENDYSIGMGNEAAVTRAYGATNVLEDKATLLGENIFSNTALLTADTKADATIIHEKTAYLIARILQKNPELAEYYMSLMEGNNLSNQIYKVMEPYHKKLDRINNLARAKSKGGAYNLNDYPEYQEIVKQLEPYNKLSNQIYGTVISGGLSSSIGMK